MAKTREAYMLSRFKKQDRGANDSSRPLTNNQWHIGLKNRRDRKLHFFDREVGKFPTEECPKFLFCP